MKRMLSLMMLASIAMVAMAWADHHVDGTWEAKIEKLTGTVTNRRGKTEIQDGKVDGDTITFTQTMEGRGRTFTFQYTGKVSGDEIQFTREMTDMGRKQAFTAKRKKSQ